MMLELTMVLGMLGCWDVTVQLLDSGWLRHSCRVLWANVKTEYGRNRFFRPAVENAAAAMQAGDTVVVHCRQGRHRTAAFLGVLKVHVTYYKPYRLRYYRFVVC